MLWEPALSAGLRAEPFGRVPVEEEEGVIGEELGTTCAIESLIRAFLGSESEADTGESISGWDERVLGLSTDAGPNETLRLACGALSEASLV